MTEISKKVGSVFIIMGMALLLCLSCLCTTATAKSDGKITLVNEVKGQPVKGMRWEIFRIGTFDGEKITLQGDFAKYPVDMSDLTAAGLADAASTLTDYAFTFKLKSAGSGNSKKDGTITFKNLEDGLYLIAAKNYVDGETKYIPTSSIVVLDTEKEAEITIYTKIMPTATDSDEVQKFKVQKIWENDENLPRKPNEIVIDIYRDYKFYETIRLSETNNWNYEWSDKAGVKWTVIERKIPEGCCIVYKNDGVNYIVVNTYVPGFEFDWEANFPPPNTTTTTTTTTITDTTTTTTVSYQIGGDEATTSESSTATDTTTSTTSTATTAVTTKKTSPKTTTTSKKLPQTGQLWWPVPVMAIGGLILIAAGTRIISGSKRDEDE